MVQYNNNDNNIMFAVPSPSVRINVLPHTIYINKALSLSCIVAIDYSVDTPITGYVIWYKDNSTIGNDNRVTISSTGFNNTNTVNSTFTLPSLSRADNDTSFTCSAMIRHSAGDFFLITDSPSEETEFIIYAECMCIKVY